jgi:cell pole-organizing protein PopZ
MTDPAGGAGRGEDERTMEEIMASIGKAVSDETQNAGSAQRDPDDDILELTDEVPPEGGAEAGVGDEELVSTSAAAASAEAFAGLAQAVEEDETAARRLPVSEGGETIEDMVRAMLKPMLNEWLDNHLPEIVERLVEEEIQRLSRSGRR